MRPVRRPADPADESRPTRHAGVLAVVVVAIAAFAYRALTADIVNDDFLHLAVAQQIVLGDLPVRDFIDPGEFLFNYASAAAQLVFGRSVGSEVLLDITALSVAHGLVFLLARRASGSAALALLTTACSILLVTRLYSYPKLLLYPLALLLAWRYVDRASPGRLYACAVCTAIAFLFRHDHGANIGAAMALCIALVHWADQRVLWRRLARYATITGVLLVPFLVFVELNDGGLSYWRNMIETGRAEYQRTVGPFPRFSLEDGLGSAENALAWFYYLTVLLPPATVLVVVRDLQRTRHESALRQVVHGEARRMAVAAGLATVMHIFLLRAASESAVADVSAVSAILGAWLLSRGVGRALIPMAATAVVAAGTFFLLPYTEGAGTARRVVAELTDAEAGPVFRRFAEYWRLRAPFDDEGARYVFACTAETDRLLVASAYAPHAYYAAGRGFAAGRQYFLSSQGPSPEFHAFSARRLREQRVPIVLVNPPDYDMFSRGFDEIHDYLQTHYRRAGTVEFDESPLDVLVDTRIPQSGTWGDNRLPCFQERRAG